MNTPNHHPLIAEQLASLDRMRARLIASTPDVLACDTAKGLPGYRFTSPGCGDGQVSLHMTTDHPEDVAGMVAHMKAQGYTETARRIYVTAYSAPMLFIELGPRLWIVVIEATPGALFERVPDVLSTAYGYRGALVPA